MNPSRSATGEIARGPSADATKATGSAVPASAQDLDPTPVQENDARPDARRPPTTLLFFANPLRWAHRYRRPLCRCSPEADTARSSRSAASNVFAARSSPPGHTLLALAVAHLLGLGTRSRSACSSSALYDSVRTDVMDAADARTGAASRDVMDDLGGDGIGIGIGRALRAAVRRAALNICKILDIGDHFEFCIGYHDYLSVRSER